MILIESSDPLIQHLNGLLHAALTEPPSLPADLEGVPLGVFTSARRRPARAAIDSPNWADIASTHPPWKWLRESANLTDFEMDVVALALAPEMDLGYGRAYGYIRRGDFEEQVPTVDLVLNLLTDGFDEKLQRRGIFAADAPLLRERIVRLGMRTSTPSLLGSEVRLDEQIVDVLLGGSGLDRRLIGSCRLSRPTREPRNNQRLPAHITRAATRAWNQRDLTFYLHGTCGADKLSAAEELAAHLQVPLLTARRQHRVDGLDLRDWLATVFREAQLQAALLFIDDLDRLQDEDADSLAALSECVEAYRGILVLGGTRPWVSSTQLTPGAIVVSCGPPDEDHRRLCWRGALIQNGLELQTDDIDALASRFMFFDHQIRDSVQTALNESFVRSEDGGSAPGVDDLFAAARAKSGFALATLAQKIEPAFTWVDIVVCDDVEAQMRELCQQVGHRGRVFGEWGFRRKFPRGKGAAALFSGAPGTGKTMAAEVVAHDLGVDLYRIDLSAVISKYIGETQKNLERIFDAASEANACLLFDEADALFGKRSAVRDAHDRYANQEVSYLLTRMEQYDGLAILTTNRRDDLDDAFLRRLQVVIEFPIPSVAERLRIWKSCIPEEAPCDADVDLALLARTYPLPGGNISNIALRAAYHASVTDGPITMSHFTAALHREYLNMSRVFPSSDLDPAPTVVSR